MAQYGNQSPRGGGPSRPGGGFAGQRGGHGGRGGPGSGNRIAEILRNPRPVRYFADPEGRAINRDLLDTEAQRLAETFGQSVKSAQLRRFYGDVMALKRQVETDRTLPDDAIRAQLALLKAKAAYAKARDNKLPDEFLRFFNDNAEAVKGRKDFGAFVRYFEAVIAFHKVYNPNDKEER